MNLTNLDLLIIVVPLALVLFVNYFMRRYMNSVADFLAANRCAGRYLISTAMMEAGSSVVILITALEVFSKTGFSLKFWDSFAWTILFLFGMLGLVVYRFRETRSLTFHQFFEVRYSKGLRVFASGLSILSGMFHFGVQPAVGARFFVYFCGFPDTVQIGGVTMQTFIPIMLVLMAMTLYFALTGGQISVLVTDCMAGVISSVFYLVVAGFIVWTISVTEMREALISGPPGASYVDPFDIGARQDFNGWYVIMGMLISIYIYRGSAWNQGFAASAKNAHEGRMAGILGSWRGYSYTAMGVLAAIAAFTMLNHHDFAAQKALVDAGLQRIGNEQLQTQMRMPMALGVLFAPGVRGAFCAVLFFGLLAGQSVQLHGYGSTILQDVLMPLRKTPFTPKAHIWWLRFTVIAVALFACVFSILFKPVEYLVMILSLISAIYVSGAGAVVWGGLYWSRGTTAGAWAAMIIGATLGISFNIIQQFWQSLQPLLVSLFGTGTIGNYFAANPVRCPLNGTELSLIAAVISGLSYVIISLMGRGERHNMDALLHRGKYRVESEGMEKNDPAVQRSWLSKFLDIDANFTKNDKLLTQVTFWWGILWKVVAICILLWSLVVGRLSENWWFEYMMFTGVWMVLVIAVITTVWFFFGVAKDLKELFQTLKTASREDGDDGMVRAEDNTNGH